MSIRRLFLILFVAVAFIAIAGIPTKSQFSSQNNDEEETMLSGRNVNMVEGDTLPDGDPWLQRQNEPSIAVSTRNALHLLAASNDYRTVDVPFTEGPLPGSELETNQSQGDAWIGIFKSFDGGESWKTELLDGYPQLTSSISPLHGYQAAADPVVRAGTDGLFYVCGMVFQRDPVTKEIGNSAIFVARYIDNNNREKGDTIEHLGTEIVLLGNPGQLFDKPWMAVDIPRNGGCGTVYVITADFVGNIEQKAHGKILFSKSTDCGQTWSDPLALTDAGKPYQGAAIAIDPEVGTIYVAMRRFEVQLGKKHLLPNAIFVVKSTDFGQSFSNKVEVAEIDPFDQPTMPTMFRTNCYPTMAVDDNGVVYVAWSQRQSDGKARIVISTSTSGSSWSLPTPVELFHPSHSEGLVGHQFMPTVAYANGKLMVAWYDSRYDAAEGKGCWFPDYINDDPGCGWRHTIDVRIAQTNPETFPIFEPSIQVSRYIWVVVQEPGNGDWSLVQGQWNPPNYPLFQGGTTPFHGDYIDMSASPMFIWDEVLGKWRFNTEPTDAPVFHVTWTDNRDVSPPLEYPWDWTEYTPPDYDNPEFSTGGSPVCGGEWRPGMRNQNVYTSKVSWGLEVGSTGNSKPLNIPRAFIIEVNNTTDEVKSFRLVIGDPGPGGLASFLQFGEEGYSILELDVTIAPHSSISRPVFFQSSDPNASLRVDVVEIFKPGGNPDPEGLTSFIILNPGDTEAVLEDPDGWEGPPVEYEEIYDPVIELSGVYDWSDAPEWLKELNPSMWSPSMWSPSMWSPSMWSNTIVVTPSMWSPSMWSPSMWSPSMWSPSMWSPSMWSPSMWSPSMWSGAVPDGTDLEGARIVDVVWTVLNEGNTTSSYTFKTFAKAALPEGLYVQLIVYKTTYMSVTNGQDCELRDAPQTELLANITNPSMWSPSMWSPSMWSTNIFNAAIENATFSVPPGEEVNVLLRLIEENPQVTKIMQNGEVFDLLEFANEIGGGVTSQQVNTSDAAAGIQIPRAAATKLLLGTAALPDGSVGVGYTGYVDAVGGDSNNYTYSLNSGELPPELYISTGYSTPYPYPRGIISGNPTTAGTYHFVVQVSDGSETDNQAYKITIHEGAVPYTPTITTPSPLPNAIQGVYYGVGLTASGGQLPYIWTLEPGSSLPDDLSLDQGGVITGKPEAPDGTYTFTVRVTDQDGDFDTKQFSLEIREFTGDITISGMIYDTDNQPLNDVVIRGLPNTPITGAVEGWADGYYEDTVPAGWEGTARPFKIDHTFDPVTREYSSGDTVADIPNQYYNSLPPLVTLTGTLTYNGASLVPDRVLAGAGNHGVYFWGNQGEGDWDFTAIYNYDDGTFTIEDVPPGDYSLSVKVDTIPPLDDFTQLPGTFRGDFDFNVPSGQPTVQIDLPCRIFMHLTDPVDGSNAGPYTIPPTNSHESPVTFTWDAVDLADHYDYFVREHFEAGGSAIVVPSTSTTDPYVQISLDPNDGNDYYTFHVLAENSTNDILGILQIVWDTSKTSSYYFTVETPTPSVDHFDFNPIGDQTASVPFTITITAKDNLDAVVTSYTGTNDLGLSTPGGSIVPPTTGSFVDGVWTGEVTIYPSTSPLAITTSGSGKSGQSNDFEATGGLIFLVQPSDANAGAAINPAVQVKLLDDTGAPLPGVSVTLAIGINPGGGTLSGGGPLPTNAQGIVTFMNLSIDKVGNGYTLEATSGQLTCESNPFNILPGGAPATKVELIGPSSVDADSISGVFTLTSQDSLGNPVNVTADTVFDLTSTSGGIVTFYADALGDTGITQVTINNGESSATFYYKDILPGLHTVRAQWSSGGTNLGFDTHQITVELVEGDIAFQSNRQGDWEIFTMKADGSGVTQLTNNGSIDQYPAWSPDGTKIAFKNYQYNEDIFIMNADGTGLNQLTNDPGEDRHPCWSPDGTKIAFQSNRYNGIYNIFVMNADGLTPPTRLTDDPPAAKNPNWSPDGTKIVFQSYRNVNAEIYVMDAVGGESVMLTQLTNEPGVPHRIPSWSPDGLKIAFVRSFDIYVMDADGSNPTALTSGAFHDYHPSWSADGTKIVFDSDRDGDGYREIWIMNAVDGSNLQIVTNFPNKDDVNANWKGSGGN